MTAAYVEIEFHRYGPAIPWLNGVITPGNRIGIGIDNYAGNPSCPPLCPLVSTQTPESAPLGPPQDSSRTLGDLSGKASSHLAGLVAEALGGNGVGLGVFPPTTTGRLNGVELTAEGIAIVDLKDLSSVWPATSWSRHALLKALSTTVFEASDASAIQFQTDGSCEAFWAWLEGSCQLIPRERSAS
jgi:hypothetical protein